jgi:hypothetical protein
VGTGVFVSAGSAGMNLPLGIAFGPNGNLYVASNNAILEFDGTTGDPIGTGVFVSGASRPIGITFGPNGNLFVTNGLQILEYNPITGAPIGNGVFASAASGGLAGLAFGPNGNLYATDPGGRVLEFDGTTGAPVGTGVLVQGGVPNTGGMSIPLGLTFGPNGNLFVASEGSLRVNEFDSTTGAPIGNGIFVADHSAGLRNPYGLAFGPDGNLFVSSSASTQGGEAGDQVLQYDGTTGAPVGNGVFVDSGSAGLSEPTFLAFGPPVAAVPEPSSLTLLALGGIALVGWRWWRKSGTQ